MNKDKRMKRNLIKRERGGGGMKLGKTSSSPVMNPMQGIVENKA
jgi:hypothetical protein